MERTALLMHLKEKGIGAIFHYVPLHSSPAGLRFGRTSGDLSITNDLSERILRLPMYYEMKNEEVERVVEGIEKFYRQRI